MRVVAFTYDVAMATLAMFAGLVLRYGEDLFEFDNAGLFAGAIVPFALAAGMSFLILRTYRTSWRHASTTDLVSIVYASSLAMAIYLLASFAVTRLDSVPRTSVVMAWIILILFMGGSRLAYRLSREGGLFLMRPPMRAGQVPILIVGGGIEAELFVRSLDRLSDYYPVGILDESGRAALIRGVPVLGQINDLARVVESYADAGDRARKIAIVDRALSASVLDKLVEVSTSLGLSLSRVPDPTVLRPGVRDAKILEPISVEDLLGRPQIVLDAGPLQKLIAGKRVLVTGAGGSIGAEIVRQICEIGPSAICLVDAAEFNLYTVDRLVQEKWPALERSTRITDVRHRARVQECFAAFRPHIVFHAAALKHVPLVEANPVEGIWTNTIGSRHVCDAAVESGCSALVLISTDKAVNPANVMGASKRGAECYCQGLALALRDDKTATRFVGVRFGNVLGSTGSVVPLFERQLQAGGPITVTHPDIERFFMTIREAVQLVLQASALGVASDEMQGRVFVLDMGEPVRIADLARQMIRLAGLQPEIDVPIVYTGLRAGEKLYEELSLGDEELVPTAIPRLNVVSGRTHDLARLGAVLSDLEVACQNGRTVEAIALLKSIVPEYTGRGPAGVADSLRATAHA